MPETVKGRRVRQQPSVSGRGARCAYFLNPPSDARIFNGSGSGTPKGDLQEEAIYLCLRPRSFRQLPKGQAGGSSPPGDSKDP